MKTKIKKDKKFRYLYYFYEKKKNILKSLMYCCLLSKNTKIFLSLAFYSITRLSSISFIKNRCILSGRPRGVVSKYKVSRHMLKKLINTGFLYTLKKK